MQNYLSLFKHSQRVAYSPVVKGKVEIDTCTRVVSLRHSKKQTDKMPTRRWVKSDLLSRNLKAKSSEWFA